MKQTQTQQQPSTSNTPGIRSGAAWIASANPTAQKKFLDQLEDWELAALPWMFEFWAMDHQIAPEGNWRTWVIMGGRGAGKTRAGSEWVRSKVEGSRARDPGPCKRVALIGETFDQARDVMVFGESGILASSPPDRRPTWVATRRRLEWPNGATAQVFSAREYEALRGPQFDCAWADELAKWPKADLAWDMLQFCLRLGDHPQQLVTTTPRNQDTLKMILKRDTTVVTHAKTEANRANLADSFLQDVRDRYANTKTARQELDGILVTDNENALWQRSYFKQIEAKDDFDRVLVAVDPASTHNENSDSCGISVVGFHLGTEPHEWRATVLADRTFKPSSPLEWAERVVQTVQDYDATKVIVETNQGGDMLTSMLRSVDPNLPIQQVHASVSKIKRAEPVALLYEQRRVSHVAGLEELEDQMCRMTLSGYDGSGSPDRADAAIWALKIGMVDPMKSAKKPGLRTL